ncbi:MAG TPA: hypothetical protein VKZ18_21415 [Polyangia bacterium]|nr:hypothetical protein [Polyangia bacterium]
MTGNFQIVQAPRTWVLGLALAAVVGCDSSMGGPGGTSGSGGSPPSSGGATGSGKGGGSAGTGGLSTGSGGASVGTGGAAGGASGAGKGTGGHLGTGGASGAAGVGASGGATGSGGNGGAGACVQNIGCTLSPPPSTGDIYQDCVNRINQFLTQCACLPALARATDGEACANQMAAYDAAMNSPHAGAIANICTPSGSQNECPGYASDSQVIGLCMQQMWSEGPPPTSSCTGTCYEQHGHYINMTDPSVHRVACGFYTTSSGDVWAAQNFLP